MNSGTNEFEKLTGVIRDFQIVCPSIVGEALYRSDGSTVPGHWSIFQVGEDVVIGTAHYNVISMNPCVPSSEPNFTAERPTWVGVLLHPSGC